MDLRTLRAFLVHLLTGLIIMMWTENPAEATQRMNFASKFFCDAIKLGCAKKRPRSSTKKHASNETRPTSRPVAKAEAKPGTLTASAQPLVPTDPKLVPRPQAKPVVLQPDNSKLASAEIEHGPSMAKLAARNSSAAFSHDTGDCRAELLKLGVVFSVPHRVQGTGECMVLDPVQLKSIETSLGWVELPAQPTLNCAESTGS